MCNTSRGPAVSLVVLALLLASAKFGSAELHSGLGFGAWDFSDSTTSGVTYDFLPVDVNRASNRSVSFNTGFEALSTFLAANSGASLALLPEGTIFEEVAEAPEDPAAYEAAIPFYSGRVWVSKTREGHYAKFRYLADIPDLFEFVYQDDGSRSFAEPVGTEVTSWGRVKALYR